MRLFLSMAALALLALPASANELESAAKEMVGVWRLDFTTPDGERRTPTVIVGRQRQELVAWVVEKDKPEAFKDICLKDDSVVATFKPKEYGGELTVTLEAKLEKEDVCCGKAKYAFDGGESGSWEFSGKRIPVSELEKATQWNLSFTTPDFEQHDALVTLVSVGDKEYGWYSGKDYELPILQASTKGGELLMSVTAKTEDGAKVEVTFRGTIQGGRVEGAAEYSLEGDSGVFAFTAKLES